jgi:hypothetical protein
VPGKSGLDIHCPCQLDKLSTVKSLFISTALFLSFFLLAGCVGRTGKVGTPIAVVYQKQLQQLKLGETTPDDLKKDFTVTEEITEPNHPGTITKTKVLVFLKEAKIENGKDVEIWEIAKGGSMDVAAFIMWGYVAYNKDQQLMFRFEDGKLVSYESVVLPDPEPPPTTPVKPPNHQ